MRDKEGPLAFRGVSVRRQLTGTKRVRFQELRLPLRLLLIVSRPTDTGFLDPRNSMAPLLDGLDLLPAGSAEVEFCEPPTLGELEERIAEARRERRPFHIVHFDGHGTYQPETGVGALCFERDDRKVDLVTGRRLGDLLSRLDVPLVILEACRTSDLSERPVLGSVAPALLESGVGSVVAFSHSVHLEAARLLVERFYRELATGLSVGEALAEARARLRAKPERWLALGPNPPTVALEDWFVPQLYQVGADPALVLDGPVATGAAPGSLLRAGWEERLHGFPPEPPYRFQGRARELLELGRAFTRHAAVVVNGGGGMGKTALAREAAAWWLRANRFEAAVFCSFEQTQSPERVAQLLGQALEGPSFDQRPAGEQQAAAVALFRQKRVLLVWDNFESALPQYQQAGGAGALGALGLDDAGRARLHALYRDLTAGKAEQVAGRLLVTCRPEATGLAGIKEIALGGLARPDSLHLLTAIADVKGINLEGPGCEPHEIAHLLTALQDHPLSISLVTPHLKALKPAEIRQDFASHLDRFTDHTAEEGRNRSLHASLAFSASRLSEPARAVLPWLAWFQGGAFENQIRNFTGLEAGTWDAVRQELEATALVRVEDLEMFNVPFLRFHPTLPYAARSEEVPDVDAAEQRFLGVYLAVSREVYGALWGKTAAAGMALMAREEANFRSAIDRAFQQGERQLGWALADTLQTYLRRAARPRERDALAAWVRAQMPDDAGLDEATCAATRQHAWGLFSQGQAGEAITALQQLIRRLETEGLAGGEDATFQIGTSYRQMGQILVNAGRSALALEPCRKAIEHLERAPGEAARENLSAALGDLANALRMLGRLPEALETAERGLAINLELGRDRNAAAGHGQCAKILRSQGRYGEAEARYQEAQRLAEQVGDLELQGTFLQHRGTLNREQGRHDQAVELYRNAIRLFQWANDQANEMRTYDLLATVESERGQLDAAEAWYTRSRELAQELGDQAQMAGTAQNLGILFQTRAEQTEDSEARETLLRRAVASVEESLAIELKSEDRVGAASSDSQLGVLHRMLGDLDRAEVHLLKSLGVRESLNLPDVWKDYHGLANVAEARGDSEAAAAWQAKCDAKRAELERLRG
jgi:tetratricopeptide (TPR) repeat protein